MAVIKVSIDSNSVLSTESIRKMIFNQFGIASIVVELPDEPETLEMLSNESLSDIMIFTMEKDKKECGFNNNYIAIIQGNILTAVQVKEVYVDGFLGSMVDVNGEATKDVYYPMLPFVKMSENKRLVDIVLAAENAGKIKIN